MAAPVHVGSEEIVLWVTADRAPVPAELSDLTWFALDLDGPHVVSMVAVGTFVLCGDSCGEVGVSRCTELAADGQGITLSPAPTGPVLIGLARSTSPPVSGSVGVRVRPAS